MLEPPNCLNGSVNSFHAWWARKAKLPTGGQPSGENLLPTECGGTPSDQWNVLKFSPDVYHFLGDVGDAIGVKPLLVVA